VPVPALLGTVTTTDALTFAIAAAVIVAGAVGVVVARNPVHAALMLVMTLFGVAVLFVEQQADFLAAVQVIVYAGAIVVLFLFVIMFLGVDREENLAREPLVGQRPLALALVALALAGVFLLAVGAHWSVGARAVAGKTQGSGGDVAALGKSVFTTYLFAFEITSALLVIAVVGAVVLARRPGGAAGRPPEAAAGEAGAEALDPFAMPGLITGDDPDPVPAPPPAADPEPATVSGSADEGERDEAAS